jgi:transcriptional regulator with XRE-family HTH domain
MKHCSPGEGKKREEKTMESFGKLLKKYRSEKRITLRDLHRKVGLSVGYLSDIEHNRRNPPEITTVIKIEDTLGIADGILVTIARNMKKASVDFNEKIRVKPKLAELLLRAEDLTNEELEDIINKMDQDEVKEGHE